MMHIYSSAKKNVEYRRIRRKASVLFFVSVETRYIDETRSQCRVCDRLFNIYYKVVAFVIIAAAALYVYTENRTRNNDFSLSI